MTVGTSGLDSAGKEGGYTSINNGKTFTSLYVKVSGSEMVRGVVFIAMKTSSESALEWKRLIAHQSGL